MAVITITTDFGTSDGYVASIKGVILTINPAAAIVDITHRITPQNIQEAALVFSTVYPYFPPKTIHVVIIDPGVGTQRKLIILRTLDAYFIAPDNGVLSHVIRAYSAKNSPDNLIQAAAITNEKYWRAPVSHTFHGRDIMAPVAGYLSLGVPLFDFGERLSSLNVIPPPVPERSPDGSLTGEVMHIDSFGNLITNIAESDLPDSSIRIEIAGRSISGLSQTYAEGAELLALIGSSKYLEVALKNGSAAAYLQVKTGDKVKIIPVDVSV